ncbi:MAG: hypothetical protein ABSF74_02515 [Dehalococcoidia bacterium]
MWVQIKSAPNKMIADMWKDFFEGEGIPTRILPDSDKLEMKEMVPYKIYVSQERVHVVEEVLRKL